MGESMKQHITKKQLREFWKSYGKVLPSAKGTSDIVITMPMNKSVNWLVDKKPEDITIGQMIEFLGDDYALALENYDNGNYAWATSVCDALWEAVKEELNE